MSAVIQSIDTACKIAEIAHVNTELKADELRFLLDRIIIAGNALKIARGYITAYSSDIGVKKRDLRNKHYSDYTETLRQIDAALDALRK